MCTCQEQYCFGCGKTRMLVEPIKLCRECYEDWLRLTPARLRDQDLTPRETHA